MNCTSLHHIEMCLGDSEKSFNLFIKSLGFRVVAERDTPTCSQKVLRQQSTILVLTQRRARQQNGGHVNILEHHTNPTEDEHFTVFCCRNRSRHTIDSVFNAALLVKNVHEVTKRAEKMGGGVIRKPTVVRDEFGQITYSIIATVGNSVHTVIDKTKYRGKFLPGFTDCEPQEPELTVGSNEGGAHPLTTHVDHIAYVCEEGQSRAFIAWYEQVFSMKRFLVNSEENIENGLEIGDTVGLRLRALEYWRCSETGLYIPQQADTSLKVVVAEPITSIQPNHVSAFLTRHEGPGLQHVAFHAPCLLHSVRYFARRGVPFRKPPPEYYIHGGKRAELEEVGLGDDADLLQEAGVLLDTEADAHGADLGDSSDRYLLQIFTEPIFGPDTFFLELVHRAGAQGFGVGNITALARSIVLQRQRPPQ